MRAFAVAVLGLAATATAAAHDEPLAGKTPGPPSRCLDSIDTHSPSVADGAILYTANRHLVWRNGLNGCRFVRDDAIPVVEVHGGRMCRGDIVRFLDRTSRVPHGACAFDDFIPYRSKGELR